MRRPIDLPNAPQRRTVDPLFFRGWVRALLRRTRLPPGKMSPPLDVLEYANRRSLIQRSEQLGPIFKGTAWGGALWIYVFGLQRGRTLLRQHANDLKPVTIDIGSLIPLGFIRQMEGESHRHYRAEMLRAVQAIDLEDASRSLSDAASRHLEDYANRKLSPAAAPQVFRNATTNIATDFLLRLIFGVELGDALHADLLAYYRMLGATGLVWNIQQRQKDAFGKIAEIMCDEIASLDCRRPRRACVLSRLVQQGQIDVTMLGNLIYIIEMGRHDIAGLLRWLTWFSARHAVWLERIASARTNALAEAFVQESLRLEQSERIVRAVKQDFVFEGFLFPRGAMVRVCVWEAHKSTAAFDQPFVFNPERFIVAAPNQDQYAPFGVDRHQCPFGGFTIRLGALFLKALAEHYDLSNAADEAAVRGQYHWEPAPSFFPILSPRAEATTTAETP